MKFRFHDVRQSRIAGLAIALTVLAQPSVAAPAVAHWTLTDLGGFPGDPDYARAFGINNAGQVVGVSESSTGRAFIWQNGMYAALGDLPGGGVASVAFGINNTGQAVGWSDATNGDRAFRWQGGVMTDLGDLSGGSDFSIAQGINEAGQVVGFSGASTGTRAFLWTDGAMTNLGDLSGGADLSAAQGINAAGQVVGYSNASTGDRAFLWKNGVMSDLGDLPGGADRSYGYGINAAGQVVGYSNAGTGDRAYLWQNGSMTDLGSLSGFADESRAYAINDAGRIVGKSGHIGNERAVLWQDGVLFDLNELVGVAGSGLTLNEARGLNDVGQIVGSGTTGSGASHGFLLTLDTTVWKLDAGGGWDPTSAWSFGVAPNRNTSVIIDPRVSLTVTGPVADTQVLTLTVGGDTSGNNGIATLSMNGGTIDVIGASGLFTTVTAKGVLTGDGMLTGSVTNLGTVTADNLILSGGLTNQGMVNGSGRLTVNLTNSATGTLRVGAGQQLLLAGSSHSNGGTVDINGGELHVTGTLTNQSGSRLILNGGRLTLLSGLNNSGQVLVSFGGGDVFGTINALSGGKIILTGNSQTTFYDAVEVRSGGELRISTGASAVFFGQVFQRTGSLFTGAGIKFYEGGLSVGASPGLGKDGGNVSFGAGNVYLAEIGGTALGDADGNGIEFDRYIVAGELSLGGTLKLVSWDGFVGQAGQTFDLFDWGTLTGRFDDIDDSGFVLAAGTMLDLSTLYADGAIRVAAVPEPETHALLLAGLGLVGWAARRRAQSGNTKV